MKDKILISPYKSPCGSLLLGSLGDAICLCDWRLEDRNKRIFSRLKKILKTEIVEGSSPVIENAAGQLDEYFAGSRRDFDLPLVLAGTDFQKAVWKALHSVPYGSTLSYLDLSRIIDRPDAIRAVANAVGANAISIFLPCHRIIGIDRSLTGYAGGIDAKKYLLNLEKTQYAS